MAEQTNQQAVEEVLTLKCSVITPQRRVFKGDVGSVLVRGQAGELLLLPRHEPILTPLAIGEMVINLGEGLSSADELILAVHGGFLDMNGKEAIIYASSAEEAGEIDPERAQEAQKRARARLDQVTVNKGEKSPIDVDRAQLALMRAVLRLRIANSQAIGKGM